MIAHSESKKPEFGHLASYRMVWRMVTYSFADGHGGESAPNTIIFLGTQWGSEAEEFSVSGAQANGLKIRRRSCIANCFNED